MALPLPLNSTATAHIWDASFVLHELARSISGQHGNLTVQLPPLSNYSAALKAVEETLENIDDYFLLTQPLGQGAMRRLRESAQEIRESLDSSIVPTLPIRTSHRLKHAGFPEPLSADDRARLKDRLKEDVRNMPQSHDPYLILLHAKLAENKMPAILANIVLEGIDAEGGPTCTLPYMQMIWDTGAQMTTITKELLPQDFRDYLDNPIHNAYRTRDGLRVQLQAKIEFSNTVIEIDAIVMVVPKQSMPNKLVGILFGQMGCIERMDYRSIPRAVLLAKKENISEEYWGDIEVHTYVDIHDKVHEY